MPCIWGVHNRSQIFVAVSIIPPTWLVGGQLAQPVGATAHLFQALVDTGATSTAISAKVATDVGLQPIGKMQVFGVAGSQYHNFYTFHVGFVVGALVPTPGSPVVQSRIDVFNDVIQGAELALGVGGFDVLLGMDVIGKGSLAVEGNGTYSFSF